MFEEATLYSHSEYRHSKLSYSEAPAIVANHIDSDSLILSAFEVVRYWQQRHQIWVHQWLAIGRVKSKQTGHNKRWFLYSEYSDKQGNSAYLQHSFGSLQSALAYAESEILTMRLPGC